MVASISTIGFSPGRSFILSIATAIPCGISASSAWSAFSRISLCQPIWRVRLVCYGILIIEHGSIRQIFQNTVNNILCILSAEGRARDNTRQNHRSCGTYRLPEGFPLFFTVSILLMIKMTGTPTPWSCSAMWRSPVSDEGRRLNQPHNCVHLFRG